MGADLTIESIYQINFEKYYKEFILAVNRRDEVYGRCNDKNNEEYRRAQDDVKKFATLMHSVGYFRDSYNNTNLLWQYKISYLRDFPPECFDEDGRLTVEAATELRDLIAATPLPNPPLGVTDEKEEWLEYFTKKRQEFIEFLNKAIELNEPIRWSV